MDIVIKREDIIDADKDTVIDLESISDVIVRMKDDRVILISSETIDRIAKVPVVKSFAFLVAKGINVFGN